MRGWVLVVGLLLPLGGCYVAPPGEVYPGYAYNDGAPTYLYEGAPAPLIYGDLGWGWYDHGHRWHGAPGPVTHDLEGRRLGGAHFHEGVIAREHGGHPEEHH